jgi:hypothetical protein
MFELCVGRRLMDRPTDLRVRGLLVAAGSAGRSHSVVAAAGNGRLNGSLGTEHGAAVPSAPALAARERGRCALGAVEARGADRRQARAGGSGCGGAAAGSDRGADGSERGADGSGERGADGSRGPSVRLAAPLVR